MDKLENLAASIFPSDPQIGKVGSIEYNLWFSQMLGVPVGLLCGQSTLRRAAVILRCVVMCALFTFIYTGFELYDLALNWRNLDAFTQNICLSLTHFNGAIKLVNMLLCRQAIPKVVKRIQLATRTYVITERQHKAFFRGELENKALLTMFASLVTFTALVANGYLFCNPEEAIQIFPYRVTLPDWMPFGVQITYMAASVMISALQIVAIDSLNMTLMNKIQSLMNVLNLAFEDLMLTDESMARETLRMIVKHHVTLIGLHHEIEDIFRVPVLFQFGTSFVIFAMTGFQATLQREQLKSFIVIYFYCGCILCQLLFFCWFGNVAFEKSNTLATSGYSAPWYKLDRHFKQSLLIFLANAQRPILFTAGGFMALSLLNFARIISKSYSFMAVLHQMYGR